MVVNDDAPVTVQDFAPRRDEGHGFDFVPLRKFVVQLGLRTCSSQNPAIKNRKMMTVAY